LKTSLYSVTLALPARQWSASCLRRATV